MAMQPIWPVYLPIHYPVMQLDHCALSYPGHVLVSHQAIRSPIDSIKHHYPVASKYLVNPSRNNLMTRQMVI